LAPVAAEAAPGPGGAASPRWSTPSALAASASAFLNRRCRNWRAARAAAPELATITGMPKKPVTSTDELIRMLMQVEAAAAGILEQQILHRLRQQTYVGGKRVDIQKLPPLPEGAATTVHRVKASLHGAKPPVWRRLEIPSAMTLDLVHVVMQAAFRWDGYHLHAFETVCGEFGAPDGDDWSERKNEATAALAQVAVAEGAKVVYTYDFGDDWRHDIVVEKIVPAEPGAAYPRCIGGRREAPPEDCGGIWAFNELQAGRADMFDADEVTENLADLPKVLTPTS
jgi:Plasmid pRiA4b ORF-3-like protein